MPSTQPPDPNIIVWFNHDFVRLGDANINVLTHGFNYGTGIFEGIRGYWDAAQEELFLFRVEDHYQRWKRNCGILGLKVDRTTAELSELTAELVRRNHFQTGIYVRPLAYKASARIGVHADDNDAWTVVAVPFGEYFHGDTGLKAGCSTWKRLDDTMIPGRAKVCGGYVNSVLAGGEARANGNDEAIFLNQDGHVAEGAAANLFMVRNGKLYTPPVTDNILEGITRDTLMTLARRELQLEVVERTIDRSELYVCDEVFLCGTAVEVAPVTQVDHRPVGSGRTGEITARLRHVFAQAARGALPAYRSWLWPSYSSAQSQVPHVVRV